MTFNLPHQNRLAIDYILSNQNRMICTIEKPKNQRSIMQNRYYRGVLCKILSDDVGYTNDEWHILLGEKFRRRTKDVCGKETEYTQSTTAMTTVEFEDYMSKIRTFASVELGCYLPLPNETKYDYLKL